MKRVVAYCRVSTDKDDQANSLESQVAYFKKYIKDNKEWEFVEIYVDEGISGTSTKKRKAFNKMIGDAELNLFDLILTKEISRFARNTLDSIFYTRKLKDLGIGVIFLNDNINTLDPDSELRLTIMSSIAQEESRKTSERVKWGQKRQMEKGVVFGRNILGYELTGGVLTVNEKEAEIIKDIFKMYVNDGMGTHTIAKNLQDRGILTKNGGKEWTNTNIFKILRNEKYMGDLIQKKTITPNYLTHEKKYNKGEEEFVIIENHHESIIDKETFKKAQKETERRRTFKLDNGKHSNRFLFSGKLKCGICNSNLVGRSRNTNARTGKVWLCYAKAKYGKIHKNGQGDTVGCTASEINNKILEGLLHGILIDLVKNKEDVIKEVEKAVINVISETTKKTDDVKNILSEIEQLESKKQKSIDLYFDNIISKDQLKAITQKYDKQLEFFKNKVEFIKKQEQIISNQQTIIDKVKNNVKQIVNGEVFSEEVCRQILDKVVVHNKTNFDVYLRSGINEIMPYKAIYEHKKTNKNNIDLPSANCHILANSSRYRLR